MFLKGMYQKCKKYFPIMHISTYAYATDAVLCTALFLTDETGMSCGGPGGAGKERLFIRLRPTLGQRLQTVNLL